MRAAQLARHPYCQCPHHKKAKVEANVVDHITPHKGDTRLFFNPRNLQSMTKECHDRFKQSQEHGGAGFLMGCDTRGFPLVSGAGWE